MVHQSTNNQVLTSIQYTTPNSFDLIERTAKIGENVIDFCKSITVTVITKPLISQLIRSGTSIGANYAEANEACSKKDFKNKLAIARKEAKETLHWLRMISHAVPDQTKQARIIYKEVHEIIRIFSASINKLS